MGAPFGNQNSKGHGAPAGNQNGVRGRKFREALCRQIREVCGQGDYAAGLDKIARVLLEEAVEKREPWAMLEVIHRIDGKPVQAIVGGEEDEGGEIRLAVLKVPLKEITGDVGTDTATS